MANTVRMLLFHLGFGDSAFCEGKDSIDTLRIVGGLMAKADIFTAGDESRWGGKCVGSRMSRSGFGFFLRLSGYTWFYGREKK
ncbi:hypothetical protein [Thiolapillus sp.]